MKKLKIVLFIFVLCILSVYANEGNTNPVKAEAKSFHFAQWAWETSYDVFDKHPITAYSYWRPVLNPVTIDLETEYKRLENNIDELGLNEVLFFHPLILNLPKDATIALGAYFRGSQVYREGWENDTPFIDDTDTKIEMLSFGFSMIWSFPAEGLQMQFLIGHTWTRAEVKSQLLSPEITIPSPPPFPPTVYPATASKHKIIQDESGLDFSYRLTWHSEKRNFLPGIDMHFKSYFPVGHSVATQTIHFPTWVHPVAGVVLAPTKDTVDSTNSTFINGRIYASIFGFLADEQQHPLYPKYIRKNYVSLDLVGDVRHVAAEHGHCLGIGFRLNLAETLFFTYMHAWEQKNNNSDYDSINLEFTVSL